MRSGFPSQTLAELRDKARYYLDAGTPEVWIIDPASRTVEVVTPQGTTVFSAAQTLVSQLLPGFRVPVRWLIDGR